VFKKLYRSFINKKIIPKGPYCYTILKITGFNEYIPRITIKPCPYHCIKEDHEKQNNGYCSLLKIGDWMDNASGLLFDHIKECGINDKRD